jgi:thiol-disulfide isomerase/thioredoxin
MDQDLLDPQLVRMPEFGPGEWLNTEHPLSRERLRGRVVLVDFWDYTCINCIRTLPYVTAWHRRYADSGLTVIGVHAPEFGFARSRSQIEAALHDFRMDYPVLLDNDYVTWDRFANRAWPSKYLIDPEGYIRYRQQGEGTYQPTEQAIQALLRLRDPDVALPQIMSLVREEDAPGAVCHRTTPELHAGYERGALGNREGYAAETPVVYTLPPPPARGEPYFYAGGIFRSGRESFAFAGQDGGRVVLPYHAVGVNAVLSPSADPVEVALRLRRSGAVPVIEVWQDGDPLNPVNAGADIDYDDEGISIVLVERPRMYELVRNPEFGHHEVELVFRATGLALYAFTFTSCVVTD